MTILLVEDDSNVASLWRRLLRELGDEIRHATDIPGAILEMRKLPPPDLVLLDLRVPGSDGPEQTLACIKELREINPNAVVLVLTGLMDDNLPALAASFGADGFRRKISVAGQVSLLEAVREAFHNRTERPGAPAYEGSSAMLQRLNRLVSCPSPNLCFVEGAKEE